MKKTILIISFSITVFTLKAQITDTGDEVGIGTTTPTKKLEVVTTDSWNFPPLRIGSNDGNEPSVDFKSGTGAFGISVNNGSTNAFKIHHGATENNLVIDNSGNIGIGTASPSYNLDISKDQNSETIIRVNNQTAGTSASAGFKVNSLGNNVRLISYADNHSTNANQNWLVSQAGGSHLIFGTQDTERLRILANGNIGIGTSNPLKKLEVVTTDSWNFPPLRIGSNDGNEPSVDFKSGTGAFGISVNNGSTNAFKIYHSATENSLVIGSSGNVGIGTASPQSKLAVDGQIRATEVKVMLDIGEGPDYVFEPDYERLTLHETKDYINKNKHLPEIPSAKEMEANGIDLGDMNMRLLKKIEELTLYQIELLERLEKAEKEISQLKKN